jgi:hypothetical protein
MQETIRPLLKAFPEATWMTVGDGSYGSDAHFLKENRFEVLATSLTSDCLAIAKEKGIID